jgi:hypothetical protein
MNSARRLGAEVRRRGSVLPPGSKVVALSLNNEIPWKGLDMSKQAAEHHKQAAEHLEQAAKQHLQAAKQHVEGGFEKAAHHAQLAHAHHVEAMEHARNAAKEHLKAHGKK